MYQVCKPWRNATGNTETFPLRPIHTHDAALDRSPLDRSLKKSHGLRNGEWQYPLTCETIAQLLPLGKIADLAKVAPVNRQTWQITRAAIPGKRIEEGICRGVVPLTSMSEHAGER